MSRLEFAASVDDLSRTSNFGNPAPINPFVNGPAHYQQQQPVLSSWPYPVMYKPVFEDIDEATSKQEKIACAVLDHLQDLLKRIFQRSASSVDPKPLRILGLLS